MGETSNYTDLDMYNQSPATVGKQNQVIGSLTGTSVRSTLVDVAAGTKTVIAQGVPGYRIWVLGWVLGASGAAGTFVLGQDDDPRTGAIPVLENDTCTIASMLPLIELDEGENLVLTTTAASFDGVVQYRVVEV